jgi:transcriptional regulator with XRE-family HTH domain
MNPELLRAERTRQGWSQAKLAEEVGVDARTVRRWEQGRAIPFPYYRKQLCVLFDKTGGHFVTEKLHRLCCSLAACSPEAVLFCL